MMATRILAIANQKGGVGKTTTAVNLATALAAVGRQVLMIDLDPQANASTAFGLARDPTRRGTYEILSGSAALDDILVSTPVPGLRLAASSMHLAGAELELVGEQGREYKLQQAIHRSRQTFDYILIDCPPSLGLLTLNALVAADGVLVPLQCEFLALEGLSNLVQTIDTVRRGFNPALMLEGIVLTMYDRRNGLSEEVARDVRSHFGDRVYQTVIPRNVRISEAPSYGLPILLYDHRSTGAVAYMKLASEMLRTEIEGEAA
jgi:chromosome partitioning protein